MAKGLVAALAAVLVAGAHAAPVEELRRSFERPPDDARIMMRWWWFGPAVTHTELEREMRAMKAAGIGGFEVQPVYPLSLDDATTGHRNLPFLSDDFLEALRFTSATARKLGLRMDVTLGSGWPYGGPQISVAQAAGRLRCERVRVDAGATRVAAPDITAGEQLLAVSSAPLKEGRADASGLKAMGRPVDGVLTLTPANEPREILFFIASRTGQMVKRPSVGAEGFVLDHYDSGATRTYLETVGARIAKTFAPQPPYAVFCDSLEVFGSDWTGDLLEQFQKRRGYDLAPHLSALVMDTGTQTADIRYDWGRTLTELLEERFLAPMQDWAKKQGALFRIQNYGTPPATLSSNGLIDLPEGEGSQWKTLRASRWASSASHIYGKPVTSSETWTWLHSPSFRATPLDIKAEADRHFLQGINQLIGHGWPYTAEGAAYPGWRFYAAGVFNDANPWWHAMPDLALYLQRVSFLMRAGRPANDVALYLPNSDAWAHFTNGRVEMIQALAARIGPDIIARVLDAGYGFDLFDDGSLAQRGRVENGALVLGGNWYRVVVLPNVERIPVTTLRVLEAFAKAGGTLIATRRFPALAPGLMATEAERSEVRELARSLFEAPGAPGRLVADENRDLTPALTAGLQPDVALAPAAPDIGFIHRSAGAAEIYFLANTGNMKKSVKATFRANGLPEVWNAMNGLITPIRVADRSATGLTLALELEPYESLIVVFSKSAATRVASANPPAQTPEPMDLNTGWTVAFGDGKPVAIDRLASWAESEATRFYSGLATYERKMTIPPAMLSKGLSVRIDFGDGKPLAEPPPRGTGMQAQLDAPVRDAAAVYVNGRRAGSVWCPPYALDITSLLHAGENQFRVVVGNTAINHMSGRRLPDYRLLNLRYGVRFEPQDMDKVKPLPSGLLGPVRLVASPKPL
ncbi:MAG TPA: glycosyl hydrolase [Bryobacteraceae bacterium]|nr:glycosyl hydrolase [Bryobacteraceae bacterium]